MEKTGELDLAYYDLSELPKEINQSDTRRTPFSSTWLADMQKDYIDSS